MNYLEALEALREYKKVRKVIWDEENYIYLDKNSNRLLNNKGDRMATNPVFGLASINAILEEEWELYDSRKKLSFKGKMLDIVKYCECHHCRNCLISPICEFSKEKDLYMADFLLEVEDYKDLDKNKIDAMYNVINC